MYLAPGSARTISALTALLYGIVAMATQEPLQADAVLARQEGAILSADFHAFVKDLRNSASIPGISVGVVRLDAENGHPRVDVASWGRRTEDADGDDLAPDTLFSLASCSKAFLATSVGLLLDDFAHGRNVTPLPAGTARLDWDTKIASILPDEWLLDDVWTTRAASIRDVLGHVSGLPRHDLSYNAGDSAEDIVRRMRHLRTAYELREKWSYNNQMYILGAHIIAKYSGMSYPDFVTERLFKPLNMSSTTFWPSEAQSSGKLTQSWTPEGRRIPFWFTDEMVAFNAGAGGIISSAEDMLHWLAVLLNKGVDPVSGNVVFPTGVYDAVTTAQHVIQGSPTPQFGAGIAGYGMGWQRWSYDGIEVISHTGGIPGFSTLTAFSPSSNLGVVILTNADEQAEHTRAILKRAFDDVLKRTSRSAPVVDESVSKKRTHPVDGAQGEPPSLDLAAYAGTYTAPGYGSLTVYASASPEEDVLSTPSNTTSFDSGPPTRLNGTYDSIWSTHVRLQHRARDTFAVAFYVSFPHGYGRDTRAFAWYEPGLSEGRVEFALDDAGEAVAGFALLIDDEAVAARQRRTGGSVTEAADAWFTKA